MIKTLELSLLSESDTLQIGAKLAAVCPIHCIIFLQGELGAGKTTFVRGFMRGLGYAGAVKSPTYTLVEPYAIKDKTLYHFDLYRLQDPHELDDIGMRDYIAQPAILLIEWPERGINLLPCPDLTCYIEPFHSGRIMRITAHSEIGNQLLQHLAT